METKSNRPYTHNKDPRKPKKQAKKVGKQKHQKKQTTEEQKERKKEKNNPKPHNQCHILYCCFLNHSSDPRTPHFPESQTTILSSQKRIQTSDSADMLTNSHRACPSFVLTVRLPGNKYQKGKHRKRFPVFKMPSPL